MATLVETKVTVSVVLIVDPDGTRRVELGGAALTADNTATRGVAGMDVTSALNPAQVAAGVLLLDAAESYLKAHFEIS
jgi:phage I-like protein